MTFAGRPGGPHRDPDAEVPEQGRVMCPRLVTIEDVRAAEPLVRPHVSPSPLIRSYALEHELGLAPTRRVWLKDYG